MIGKLFTTARAISVYERAEMTSPPMHACVSFLSTSVFRPSLSRNRVHHTKIVLSALQMGNFPLGFGFRKIFEGRIITIGLRKYPC